MMSPRPEFGDSVMPATVFGSVKMLLLGPAALDGGGVLGGAVVGPVVDGDVRAGAA